MQYKKNIPQPFLARFLLGAGRLAWVNGRLARSRQHHQQALVLARELGDKRSQAWSLVELAANTDQYETYEVNMGLTEEARWIFSELDHKPGIVYTLGVQGELARNAGDLPLAREKYETALKMSQQTGEIMREMMMMDNLSFVAYHDGDYASAYESTRSFIKQVAGIGWRHAMIDGLWSLAGPLAKLGQPEKAARLLGASATLAAEMGVMPHPSDWDEIALYSAHVRIQLEESVFAEAFAQGQRMSLEQAVACALAE